MNRDKLFLSLLLPLLASLREPSLWMDGVDSLSLSLLSFFSFFRAVKRKKEGKIKLLLTAEVISYCFSGGGGLVWSGGGKEVETPFLRLNPYTVVTVEISTLTLFPSFLQVDCCIYSSEKKKKKKRSEQREKFYFSLGRGSIFTLLCPFFLPEKKKRRLDWETVQAGGAESRKINRHKSAKAQALGGWMGHALPSPPFSRLFGE